MADDPAVARFDPSSRRLTAEKAGKTIVHFRIHSVAAAMPVEVKAVATAGPAKPSPAKVGVKPPADLRR